MKGLGFCMSQRDFFCCFIVLTSTYIQVLNTLWIQTEDFNAFSDFDTALPEHHILNGLVIWLTWTFLLQ